MAPSKERGQTTWLRRYVNMTLKDFDEFMTSLHFFDHRAISSRCSCSPVVATNPSLSRDSMASSSANIAETVVGLVGTSLT
ncbi:Hypothetical protein NTJ_05626 [Nesidiocoris tenuis]|uniref:Uncharacterized protein n=1 Tax=Nesidiocoris tenuis TaxID=355587 RepID=A0ABN7AKP7_9HEMI|nr:Hypothetical protein NTJ_05626 [Nesidiocoris tenuis]